jgi:hypothetical protein
MPAQPAAAIAANTPAVVVNASPVMNAAPVTVNPTFNLVLQQRAPLAEDSTPAPIPVAALATVRATELAVPASATTDAKSSSLLQRLTAARDEAATVRGKIKAMNAIKEWDWHDKLVSRYV